MFRRKSDQAEHKEIEEDIENMKRNIDVPLPSKKTKHKDQLLQIRKHIERLPKYMKKRGFKGYHFGDQSNNVEIVVVLILHDLLELARENNDLKESTEPLISQRMVAFRHEHQHEISERDSRIAALEKEVRWLKIQNDEYQSRVDRIKLDHRAEVEQERRDAHEKETRLKVQNDSMLNARDQHHGEYIHQLNQDFEATKASHEIRIEGERKRTRNEREECESEKQEIKLGREEEKRKLKAEQARQKKQLLKQQAKMAKENEALNRSLLTRDHFKLITDLELKMLFTDLESDVTHLATLRYIEMEFKSDRMAG